MRRQIDYNEVFKTAPFSRSPDSDFKLFLSLLLGLDVSNFEEKYDLNSQIEELETFVKSLKRTVPKNTNFDEIKAILSKKNREIDEMNSIVNSYEFETLDKEIIFEMVQDIDGTIAEKNSEIYKLRFENKEMTSALAQDIPYNFHEVEEIFKEVGLHIPDALVKSYEEVEEFNRVLFEDRKIRIQDTIDRNLSTIEEMQAQLNSLSMERNQNISILQDSDIFQKHKKYTEVIKNKEAELFSLKTMLADLERISEAEVNVRNLKSSLNTVINKLQQAMENPSKTYISVQNSFEQNVKEILSVDAILAVGLNRNGNPDPEAKILDSKYLRETNESRGTTYRKMLCVSFDLSLAEEYSSSGYYRYIYHDGVLEGLNNRKKVSYLNLIRRKCLELDLQYIITVIDSDVPRDEADGKQMFSPQEIIRRLSDQGDEGRLFRMPAF